MSAPVGQVSANAGPGDLETARNARDAQFTTNLSDGLRKTVPFVRRSTRPNGGDGRFERQRVHHNGRRWIDLVLEPRRFRDAHLRIVLNIYRCCSNLDPGGNAEGQSRTLLPTRLDHSAVPWHPKSMMISGFYS